MRVAEPFRRHDWVWLGRETHLPDVADVRCHCAAGLPFTVCRHTASTGEDSLRLGLALPDKRRIGFCVEASGIRNHRPPLSLRDVLRHVPEPWLPVLDYLTVHFKAVGMEARVYGSAAWQAMTGASYLREDSDLDLLLAPTTEDQLRLVLGILGSMDGTYPRLDGEIVLPDGRAVAWREAASDSATLLVKALSNVSLVPRSTWLSALQDPAHV
jgi:phosphoribosyl-dephospho-CoA transferase